MLKRVTAPKEVKSVGIPIGNAAFPSPFSSGLEYASPARGTWNIVHTGMLIPEAHEIFVCAAGCLRGVVLTAAELNLSHRFSTVEVKENNLLDGDMEELVIEGVSDILEKLPKKPPVVLVYTSCVHHFAGCDLDMIYGELRLRYPGIDFVDCYMNPIMRKSGLTPDQLMRSRLYMPLKARPIQKGSVAIIGSDLPTDPDSDLVQLLRKNNLRIHEITSCKSYEEYQEMAESECYISCYPAAKPGGDMLAQRLGSKHIYVPFSFDYAEIEEGFTHLAETLGVAAPDFAGKREAAQTALKETLAVVGSAPIAIDYTYCPRPLGLAKLLLDAGFSVKRVYLDVVTGEEKQAFTYLKENYPHLELYPTVHASMRFLAEKEPTNFLAIGQKAAHFLNTTHFVNVVEGGGMLGYQAIFKTLELMQEAHREEKDMRNLIQIKGMGCGGCCG
ncbi:MAG: nitrogenase [Oscillospiraceae bacterium]|nr:nitrogenase [Oscillospiraceae bacterium]